MRVKKSIHNIIAGLSCEVVTIICSLILPRLILTSFGSDYNGLTSAINQFLRMVVLLQAGVGGVVQAALYKPLAENNSEKVSIIILTARKYLRKIAFIFIGVAVTISVLYPFVVLSEFDWFFTFSLVLIMSLGSFVNLFISAGYGYLITANQKNSINFIINIITLVLTTFVSVIMINMGFGIHVVKFVAVITNSLRPVLVYVYVRRNFDLNKNVKPDNNLMKQRWDNFAQDVANFICSNTSLVIISLFTNVYEVSVYTVYMLVVNGIWGIVRPFCVGVEAAFGNMFAKNEEQNIQKGLRVFEMLVFSITTILLGVTLVMIIPFVMLYTTGVTDVDYYRGVFSVLVIIATMFRCFRLPYVAIVCAVGHFKQTRNGAIIEMTLNIVISLTLVFKFGIIGVVSATLFSMMFRTVQYALYVSKNVIHRSIYHFFKRISLSFMCICVIAAFGYYFNLGFDALSPDIGTWVLNAVLTTILATILIISVEAIFYRDDIKTMLVLLKKGVRS